MKILGISYNFKNDLVMSLIDDDKFIHSTTFSKNYIDEEEVKKYIEYFDVDMIAVNGYGIGNSFYEKLKNILEKPILSVKLNNEENNSVILDIVKSKILDGVNINISFKINSSYIRTDCKVDLEYSIFDSIKVAYYVYNFYANIIKKEK